MHKKVIFIDWNRTLSYNLFWEHLSNSSHPHNKYHSPIVQWLFVDNKDIVNPWMRGAVTLDEIVEQMSRETAIDSKLIQDELVLSCQNMSLCSPDIETIIQELRNKGFTVVIATDNMDTFRAYTVPALQLDKLFDDILVSSELGVLKDDATPSDTIKFFDAYLSEKGLNYNDAILLDDSPDSSGKYSLLGFERVLIDSPTKLITTLNDLNTSYVA